MDILNITCWEGKNHEKREDILFNNHDRFLDEWWVSTYEYIESFIGKDLNGSGKVRGFDRDRGDIWLAAELSLWDVISFLSQDGRGLECPAFMDRDDITNFRKQFEETGIMRFKKHFDGTGEYELDMTANVSGRNGSNWEWTLDGHDGAHDERDGKATSNIELMLNEAAELLEDFAIEVRSTALQKLRDEHEHQTSEVLEEWVDETVFDKNGNEVFEYTSVDEIKTLTKNEVNRMRLSPGIAKWIFEYCNMKRVTVLAFVEREFPSYHQVPYNEGSCRDAIYDAIVNNATQGRLF